MPADCLFCRIAAREQQAEIVHATDRVVAFRDIDPKAPVHILIIPKEHVPSARELSEKDAAMLAEVFSAAAHLARAEGIDRSGWRIVSNVGDDAGQSVLHLHFHLLGGRAMTWPPG
jgi:histidine triad (HIT) family protein